MNIAINNNTFSDYLNQQNIHFDNNSNKFIFDSESQFSCLASHYIFDILFSKAFELNAQKGLFSSNDKSNVKAYYSNLFSMNICGTIQSKIQQKLPYLTSSFDPEYFTENFLEDEWHRINYTLANVSNDYYQIPGTTPYQFYSKMSVLYVVVENNGSITLREQDTSFLKTFPYQDQEQAIAQIIHLNPSMTIVYDHMCLMKPEMVINLKKFQKRKVDFIEDAFPLP